MEYGQQHICVYILWDGVWSGVYEYGQGCMRVYILGVSSSFLTAVMVSLASWVKVVVVTLACLERYCGGRGLPVTASPRTTDSPFP